MKISRSKKPWYKASIGWVDGTETDVTVPMWIVIAVVLILLLA